VTVIGGHGPTAFWSNWLALRGNSFICKGMTVVWTRFGVWCCPYLASCALKAQRPGVRKHGIHLRRFHEL